MAIWVNEDEQDPFQKAIIVLCIECHVPPNEYTPKAFKEFGRLTRRKLGERIKHWVDRGYTVKGKIRYMEVLRGPSMEYHVITAEIPIGRADPKWDRTSAPVAKSHERSMTCNPS